MKQKNCLSFNIISQYRGEIYGFCILWIMCFHSYKLNINLDSYFPDLTLLNKFISFGNQGVEVFLFMSGVCLYYSFTKDSNILHFMKKRFLRLFIPVLIINIPYEIASMVFYHQTLSRSVVELSLTGFYTCGFREIWFISIILLCYVLYPYIFTYIYKNEKVNITHFITIIAVYLILIFSFIETDQRSFDRYEIGITRLLAFFIGCAMGSLCKNKKKLSWFVLCFFALCALLNYLVLYNNVLMKYSKIFTRLFGVTAIGFTFVLAIIFKTIHIKFISKILCFLGNISLEIYIAHISLIILYKKSPLYKNNCLSRYMILLAISLVIAYLTYLLENYFRKQKRKV